MSSKRKGKNKMAKTFRYQKDDAMSAFEKWFDENYRTTWSTSTSFKMPAADRKDRAKVSITGKAWAKMQILVQTFDSEVAWHGFVTRDESEPASFVITDIVLYPQEVTGATVNTDQQEYQNWMFGLTDEQLLSMRFQGHSHVNMGVTPSPTDVEHQESIVCQMKNDDFYIFGIFNKKGDITLRVFDCKTNVYYETKDIDFEVVKDDISVLRDDMKTMVKKKTYAAGFYSNGYQSPYTSPAKTTPSPQPTAAKSAASGTAKQTASKSDPITMYGTREDGYGDYGYEYGWC